MYQTVSMTRYLRLHPSTFGPGIEDILSNTLLRELEGTSSGKYGMIVCITGVTKTGAMKIEEGTGFAVVPVQFSVIVCKPFQGEVLDAKVLQVSRMGVFAQSGPIKIFISHHLLSHELTFNDKESPSCYSSEDNLDAKIAPGNNVRLRIVGTRADSTDVFSIGSMNEPFLGRIY